jgi:23S rRNA (uracil1939-C5)-methyltransferase
LDSPDLEIPSIVIQIEKLVHGGLGIGFHGGKTYFVEGVCPGETVLLKDCTSVGRNTFAKVGELMQASPQRRQPFCSVVDECGGCDWQHLNYKAQLEAKKSIFIDCLKRLGKLPDFPEVEIFFGDEQHYRHRAQFKTDGAKVGFYGAQSHQVVEFSQCPILVDELNDFAKALRQVPPQQLAKLKDIKAIAGSEGQVASEPAFQNYSSTATSITCQGFKFVVSGDGFFQQNRNLTGQMGGWVQQQLQGDLCYDLFGGSGFFSLMVHKSFKRVILIERSKALVKLAKATFQANRVFNIQAKSMSSETFFQSLRSETQPQSCSIIVDPPRGGLSPEVREGIINSTCESLVYVACDPATQARDLGELVRLGGFQLKKLALFDLYPNTHHMETAGVLVR